MTEQSALVLEKVGAKLVDKKLGLLEPGEHEVLVEVLAVGLCPHDRKVRDEGLFGIGDRLPAVLGNDVAGRIINHGPAVSSTSSPLGAHIFGPTIFTSSLGGGLQQYSILDTRHSAPIPSSITALDAAVFPINAFTSAVALFAPKYLGLPFPGSKEAESFNWKETKLAIIGGGTNCGKFAIQFARLAGVGTIVTTAGLAGEADLKAYGATHVVDRKLSNAEVEKQIRDIVGDDLTLVYDTISEGDHSLGVSLLSTTKKGRFMHLLFGKPDETLVVTKKAGYEIAHVFGASSMHPDFSGLFWKALPNWVQDGHVKVLKYGVIQGLDVEQVNAALDAYKQPGAERKHVSL